MPFDVHRFESLGANCEFGFFLQDHGNHETSLFKWAEVIGIAGLTRLIQNDFADMFAYETIAPFNANMVLDQAYWIAWHSKFEAGPADPAKPFSRMNARFTTPPEERRALWEEQNGKLQHFVGKLRTNLRSGDRVFVYKPRGNDKVSEDEIVALSDSLRSFGSNTLLAVTLAERPEEIGTVRSVGPGLLRGYIDRLAPGDRANDYSRECWERLCEAALSDIDGSARRNDRRQMSTGPAGDDRGLIARAAAGVRRFMGRN